MQQLQGMLCAAAFAGHAICIPSWPARLSVWDHLLLPMVWQIANPDGLHGDSKNCTTSDTPSRAVACRCFASDPQGAKS